MKPTTVLIIKMVKNTAAKQKLAGKSIFLFCLKADPTLGNVQP